MEQVSTSTIKDPGKRGEENLDSLTVKFFSYLGLNQYIHDHAKGMKMALEDYNKSISELIELKKDIETYQLKLECNPSFPKYDHWHQHFKNYIAYIHDIIEIKKEQMSIYSKQNNLIFV